MRACVCVYVCVLDQVGVVVLGNIKVYVCDQQHVRIYYGLHFCVVYEWDSVLTEWIKSTVQS